MGFGFRKSVGFGPLRFTASKSGISTSIGVKGFRVTAGPRGTHFSVGANGFYYRQPIGTSKTSRSATSVSNSSPNRPHQPPPTTPLAFSTDGFIEELNQRAGMRNGAAIAGIFMAIFLLLSLFESAWFIAALSVSPFVWILHRRFHDNRYTHLHFDLDETSEQRFTLLTAAIETLALTDRLWVLQSQEPTDNWKRNAGARMLVTRQPASAGRGTPPYITCNHPVQNLHAGGTGLYFFPDRLLLMQGGRFGALAYQELKVNATSTTFVEEGNVCPDTEIIGHTWRHPKADGGPDMRFRDNRRIPKVRYGELNLYSSSGFRLTLQTSRALAAEQFCERWQKAFATKHCSEKLKAGASTQHLAEAWKTLELTVGAASSEITAAYRRMAALYHPDKVCHLAPELQALAERRMREINAAYELLRTVPN